MFPDPKWLEILKASSWQFFGLAIGCVAGLVVDAIELLPFKLEPILKGGLLIGAALFTGLWIASIGQNVSKIVGAQRQKWKAKQALQAHADEFRDYVPFMTEEERAIFAQLLHENRKSFTGDADGGLAATLLGRKFVTYLAVSGQRVSYDDMPFAVPDHIWAVAVGRKSDFPYKPDQSGKDAWREHWMVR